MSDPYCLAMVLCDAVHRDPATGKSTILGTFSTVGAREFPAPIRLCVYWAITDAMGEVELTFRLVNAKDILDDAVEPVFSLLFPIVSPSPLSVNEGHFGLEAKLPEQAVYHCEMLAGNNLLMSRRLVAIDVTAINKKDDHNE